MRRTVRHLPQELRRHLPTGVRILAVRELTDGTWAVAANTELLVLGEDKIHLQCAWAEVDRATMDADTEELTITWVNGRPDTVLGMGEQAGVADFTFAVKERVDNSLVHLELEEIPGGGALRGAIRRNRDGSLFSQVTVSGVGHPPADLDRRAADLEARIRGVVGLTR